MIEVDTVLVFLIYLRTKKKQTEYYSVRIILLFQTSHGNNRYVATITFS